MIGPLQLPDCFKVFRTFSLNVLALLVLIQILEFIPPIGIFITLFGGVFVTGILIHAFLLALLMEATVKAIPRGFIAIPLLAYGGYFGMVIAQSYDIADLQARLKANNPHGVMAFDPASEDLVMPLAYAFVERHKIPIAYQPLTADESFVSDRLATPDICDTIVSDGRHTRKSLLSIESGWDKHDICRIETAGEPTRERVTITTRSEDTVDADRKIPGWSATETIYEMRFRDRTIGRYRTASVSRYSVLPFLLAACMVPYPIPNSFCSAEFLTDGYNLDTRPEGAPAGTSDDPVSVMLGIAAYTKEDRDNFAGFGGFGADSTKVH